MVAAPDLKRLRSRMGEVVPIRVHGKVTQVVGLVIEGHGPGTSVGGICEIYPKDGHGPVRSEVVGFREGKVLLMPLADLRGIAPGCPIVARDSQAMLRAGRGLLGRVVNGLGEPIDGQGPIPWEAEVPIYSSPVNPLHRRRIAEPLDLGIRAINGLLTCGRGQRLAVLSGSGVGKSVLLGMMARYTAADVNVVGLIGERGREVTEFLEKDLGEEGRRRSVVVVATSDEPPLVRMRGAFLATTIAEYFSGQGQDVLLLMDSVTRFAMAQREVGLSIGEPPATKGYTPSVFALLPKLLERPGAFTGRGSITGLYTVLVEGDDLSDPIADSVRSIVDGHIVLSRDLANQGHYPAVDVLQSTSRVMIDVIDPRHHEWARRVVGILSTYRSAEDLINIGAYVTGSNPRIDYAVTMIDRVRDYLRQDLRDQAGFEESVRGLQALFA
ncbi:MAG: FliI/YscN family ATPase [Deltaproteobacteria bacterium]|nr:FliI/YscN family ATPase [Deltaproteobacteria bacterium]